MKRIYPEQHEFLDIIDAQVWQLVDPVTYGTVNQAHAAFFGMSKADLDGKNIEEIFPLETAQALSDQNSMVFKTGIAAHNTKAIQNVKNESRHISITKRPKLNCHGKVEYVVCYGIDVTEYQALEADLHQSNANLRTFLAASPIGIGIIENRKISWVNDQMAKIFGYESTDEIVGRSTKEFYADREDFNRLGSEVYNKLISGRSVEKDLAFRREDGSEFIGHLKMSSYDASDPAKKAIITISDITLRKKAEEQRIQSEKLKGVIEMAGAVCHELNQPLQAISGYSELLTMDLENNSPICGQLHTIIEQVERMGELTRKLQKITKYETKDYLEGKIIDIERSASKSDA